MPESKKQLAKPSPIRADMRVAEIISLLPEAGPLLSEYGLHCFSCSHNAIETLAEGCESHGFDAAEIDGLVRDLNTLYDTRPARPQTLTVTLEAAKGLREILVQEQKLDHVLVVGLDEAGSFCLEFAEKTPSGAKIFTHREVPELTVAALTETLERIGGATIDRRDGRFKLDLPEAAATPGCACSGGRCSCADRKTS